MTADVSRTLFIKATVSPPCTLVILGASGDLCRRKLLPALWNLMLDGSLPKSFAVMGVARGELGDAGFRKVAREGIASFSRRPLDPARWDDFEGALFYQAASFDDADSYSALRQRLETVEAERGIPGNRVFYLAVPPTSISQAIQRLRDANLISPEASGRPISRVIVEKPIGRDLASAIEVNGVLASALHENNIFRIDHYLGKETVQNIMVMRFANSIFEPLWNQKYIDHVQITVAEEVGVGSRAGYYEEAGALRDMVQNHILQLLSLTAMESPWSLAPDVVRDHKLEVLQCLRRVDPSAVEKMAVRAQYGPGRIGHDDVRGYRREDDVHPESTTETYVALKLFIDNWRWAGVPFYLRTGKRMTKRVSEIAVQFKDVPQILFNADPGVVLAPNILTLRIQPDEGLALQISAKKPGPKVTIEPVEMDFGYSDFQSSSPEAYERLLLDVMVGDATLFMRRDAVEASWAWVTDLLAAWSEKKMRWLPEYPAGSWGPVEAEKMVHDDGRKWREL